MGSAATSQLNVRMDSELRTAGDAVLARVGATPAEVIRALWTKIAKGVQECEQVLSLLAEREDSATISRGDELLSQIEGWHSKLYALAEDNQSSYVAPTDDELDEMLYDEWLMDNDGRTTAS